MVAVTDQAALESELASFMGEYEQANNSHDIERVVPFLAARARRRCCRVPVSVRLGRCRQW
ncbi:hypothetical protein [Streptomyces sp. 351MFTsu5.1]|uniref:hypothetical protein n=1 Tax=Streptomyces sp. 351MFTsu5.1 TaxID=1172180 RepID=UPI0003A25469|nr:hypothetical protein [Streptomyces sp. 351MFTsu5.1]